VAPKTPRFCADLSSKGPNFSDDRSQKIQKDHSKNDPAKIADQKQPFYGSDLALFGAAWASLRAQGTRIPTITFQIYTNSRHQIERMALRCYRPL
jgi:hypothetical protein